MSTWPQCAFSYDGSFAGFLTCVGESFRCREYPFYFLPPGAEQISLYPLRPIQTDRALAKAVYAALEAEVSESFRRMITYSFLTCLPQKERHIYDVVHLGLTHALPQDPTDDRILILSMGGSLGADAINHAMCELIAKEKDNKKLCFIHAYGQYGQYVPDELKELGVDADLCENITLREYIDDMEVCMPAADIVICRSGASSLYEIRALGKASILVPSPNVAENHQYYNAMELVDRDAALIIEQKDLTGETLYEATESLVNDPERIRTIEANARAMAILDATERIAGNLMDLAKAHVGEEHNG